MSTTPVPPPNEVGQPAQPADQNKKGMAITAMVIGIVAIAFSFIPVLGTISLILGPVAVILGVISLVKKRGKGQAITGVVTGAIGTIIALIVFLITDAFVTALDEGLQEAADEIQEEIEEDAETAEEELPADAEWVEIATLSGKNDQRGEVFTINSDARLSYEFDATDEDFSIAAVYLMKKGETLNEDGGLPELMLDGSESGETLLYQTGDYYLDVTASGYGSWTVTIEELQ